MLKWKAKYTERILIDYDDSRVYELNCSIIYPKYEERVLRKLTFFFVALVSCASICLVMGCRNFRDYTRKERDFFLNGIPLLLINPDPNKGKQLPFFGVYTNLVFL